MTWFVCAALVIVAGCYVLFPLFREPKEAPETWIFRTKRNWTACLTGKPSFTATSQDLNFEHAMGRLSDADYRRLQADYKNDAALLLQKLDQLGASEDLDNAIEKDIAARKAALFAPETGPENAFAALRAVRKSFPGKNIARIAASGFEMTKHNTASNILLLFLALPAAYAQQKGSCGRTRRERNGSIDYCPFRRIGYRRAGRRNENSENDCNRFLRDDFEWMGFPRAGG